MWRYAGVSDLENFLAPDVSSSLISISESAFRVRFLSRPLSFASLAATLSSYIISLSSSLSARARFASLSCADSKSVIERLTLDLDLKLSLFTSKPLA